MNKKKVTIILIGVLLVIVSVFFINNSNNGIFKNIDMTNSVDEGDDNLTDFQKENKEKEKEIHQKAVSEKIEQLDNDKGLYSTDSIVLSDTTKEDAEHIAEEIGAEVRMTKKGDFAVLYLPKDVSIEDIYDNDKYASYIPQMTPDYYVSTNLINGNGMDEEDVIPDADMVVRNHPNYSINDPAYTNQQYIDYINLKDTWEGTRGAGITVAIIDSGIDTDHAEFIGKISEKSYNASEDKIVKDYDISVIEDENGHGTAVAGVLAASMNNSEGITGISPDVNLVVIKCDVDDTGKFVRGSDLVFGLAYAIESDVDIINMSFGSPVDIFSRYTELAVDSDIICIAVAGNDGSNMPVYPASLDSVIAVGAYDTENGGLTEYSNYGDNVDLLAPGTAYTTYIDGGYKMSTGTSISAPIVSGAAALYIASNGKTQFDEMRQLFEASSHDLGDPGQDYRHGFGELDVYALVCEEKGTITYDMLTDEVENEKQIFVKGHTVQVMPEPEREYSVCDGWFFDPNCYDECDMYTYVFNDDTTLYAEWINEDEGVPFTYSEQEDGTIVILSYTGKRRFVSIPAEIEGKKVTRIANAAFMGNRRIRNMTLPDGIVEIGERAFANCDSLRIMDIPDKTKRINREAFDGCVRLNKVNIMHNSELTDIGECAFRYTGLAEFDIPQKLANLGNMVFYGCMSLNKMTVASGNTSYQVKNDALYDISGSKLIYYPSALSGEYAVEESTKYIDNGAFAFSRCTEININDGIVAIGDSSFEYSSIKKIDIPKSVEMIGSSLCNGCSYLKEVYFAENGKLNIINSNAFSRTGSLTKIEIPDYVESIAPMAFIFSTVSEITISDSSKLKEIGESAFAYTNIDKIKIPDAVETIGEDTFSYDSMLTEVSFTNTSNCNKILKNAFLNDIALKEFSIPDKVTELGERAFFNCGIEKINIGKSLTNLGSGVFSSCNNLSYISVSEGNPKYASYEGVLYNNDKTVLMIFPAAKEGTYTMPQEVITIAPYAFSGADKLNGIIMNEGLVTIGENAFEYCQSMETPILPSTLEEIDGYAFTFCSAMRETLVIPKNVKSISWFAFSYDYELSNIDFEPECKIDRISYGAFANCGIEDFTIPTNVSTMAQEVFRGCDRLLTVTFEADSKLEHLPAWAFNGAENLRRITFEEGCNMTTIEARACEGLKQLENIDFSGCSMLKCIDNYAFKSCVELGNIDIPKTVNEIGRYAFYGCCKMNEMRIPNTILRIGRYAFTRTDSINIYFESAVLPNELEDNWDYGIGAYYVGIDSLHENDEWVYAVTNDAKASVIKYKGNSSTVELNTIDGYEVASIGSEAFKNNTILSGITLPATLTGIYRQAFYGTSALESINIPSAVKVIESEAFKNSGIKTVVFGQGSKLTSMGSSVFEKTAKLTEIELPSGITIIRDNLFYQSGITSVTLPNGISEIGRLAFAETKLESIVIPSSVKDISYKAFKDTTKLSDVRFASGIENVMIRDEAFYHSGITEVALPKGIGYIGSLCFARCGSLTAINVAEDNNNYASDNGVLYDKALTKLINCPAGKTGNYTVPKSVMTFSFGAFEGCKLSEVIIPNECKLITLGHRVFYDCDNLVSITIPDSVQSIDYYAFAYCDNLENVTINPDSQINGIYSGAFYNCSKLNGIVIPDNVLEISDYAFYGCSSLSDVDITENSRLQGVYDHAFEYTAIENFVMPSDMLELGAYSFHATKLKTFVFNDVLTDIGDYALAESGLTETTVVEVPVTVEHIGKYFLEGIESIEELTLPFLGESVNSVRNATINYTFNDEKQGITQKRLLKLKKVSVLQGKALAEKAFSYLSATEIYVPKTITKIEPFAFEGTDIENIVLSDDIEELQQGVFRGCNNLKEFTIPEKCQILWTNVFYGSGLEKVNITANLKTIDKDAFLCGNLSEITVDNANKNFKSVSGILYNYELTEILVVPKNVEGKVIIPEGVKQIAASAFHSCKKMTGIVMPDSLEIIDNSAFSECDLLKDIEWSQNLKEIGYDGFSGCDSLVSVILPNSITFINNCCFANCQSLKNIVFSDNIEQLSWGACANDITLEDVYIGTGTVIIEQNCFNNCGALKIVALPEGLIRIGETVFERCSSMTGIYLPKGLETIGNGAFSECESLNFIEVDEDNKHFKSADGILYDYELTRILFVPRDVSGNIRVPDGVVQIDEKVFYDHDSIKGIYLPGSVKKIGDYAFADCACLKNVNFGENINEIGRDILSGTPYVEDSNNYIGGVLYVDNYVIGTNWNEVGSVVKIKDGTTLIAKNAFYSNDKVSKLYLPDTINYINSEAFRSCSRLTTVYWGKNITSILGFMTFGDCNKIKSLYLVNKDIETDMGAFNGCSFEYVRINSDEFKNIYDMSNRRLSQVI